MHNSTADFVPSKTEVFTCSSLPLKIAYTNKFHDRFIVIDNNELYHCGASLKDLGKKCFAISKIEDAEYIKKLCEI